MTSSYLPTARALAIPNGHTATVREPNPREHQPPTPGGAAPGPRRRRVLAVVVAVAALALGGCAIAAETAPSLDWTNGQRSQAGVPLLTWDPQLAACADSWAAQIAARGALVHDDLLRCMPAGATKAGENLASATSLDGAHRAILGSPPHVANMLDATWRRFGVGYATSGGTTYVVWRFSN